MCFPGVYLILIEPNRQSGNLVLNNVWTYASETLRTYAGHQCITYTYGLGNKSISLCSLLSSSFYDEPGRVQVGMSGAN